MANIPKLWLIIIKFPMWQQEFWTFIIPLYINFCLEDPQLIGNWWSLNQVEPYFILQTFLTLWCSTLFEPHLLPFRDNHYEKIPKPWSSDMPELSFPWLPCSVQSWCYWEFLLHPCLTFVSSFLEQISYCSGPSSKHYRSYSHIVPYPLSHCGIYYDQMLLSP